MALAVATRTPSRAQPDRRRHARITVMIPAAITMPDGTMIACVIRDISCAGARLSVARRHRLGATFPLHVPGHARPFPMCRVWQRGDEAGTRLDIPADPALEPVPP